MRSSIHIIPVAAAGIALLVTAQLLTAQTAEAGPGFPLTKVSGSDPYASCTVGGIPGAVAYTGSEVEPELAIDPQRPNRLIGVWQQDRWSAGGGSRGIVVTRSVDGGRTFSNTTMPVTRCAGGLDYERASFAWVSIGPDGTAYGSAFAFDVNTARNTVAASASDDVGLSWRNTTALIDDTSVQFLNDRNSVTADPLRPGTAYQIWSRIDGGPTGAQLLTGPTMLSVTHDHGHTWSQPRVIIPTGSFQQTVANVIVADPRTGALYDFFTLLQFTDDTGGTIASADYAMSRSFDGGQTWSAPIVVTQDTSIPDFHPNTGVELRTGAAGFTSPAVDPVTGQLYLVFQATDFTNWAYNQVELVTSTDQGTTWTRPIRVNAVPSAEAFNPRVAVSPTGQVAVMYSDLRTLTDETTTLPTSTWLTVSPRGGEHFDRERQIAPVFDFMSAPILFLGRYQGLVTSPTGFRPLFAMANSNQPDNRSDIFTGTFSGGFVPTPTAAAAPGKAPPRADHHHRPLPRHSR